MMINVGILLAYLAGAPYEAGLTTVSLLGVTIAWWRVMIALSIFPAALQVCLPHASTNVGTQPLPLKSC